MAAKKQEFTEQDLQGLKHFRSLRKLLVRLHGVGASRDKAGNRELFMDQYCVLVLVWLFNPLIKSLRGLQRTSDMAKVRKRLGVSRSSLGSLSESVAIFDPEPLAQIAAELAHTLPDVRQGRFDVVRQQLTAVDGSVVTTLARVAGLCWTPKGTGKAVSGYRLHTQFEVLRGLPSRIDVTPANPRGDADERVVLERTLEPDRCYVVDRGYAKFTLWNAIVATKSSYVCRIRDNAAPTIHRTNELSDADRDAGILSDEVVVFGAGRVNQPKPDHPVRLVTQGSTLRRKRLSDQHAATPDAEEPVGGGKLKTRPHREPVNSATHERSAIRPRAVWSRIRRRRACRSRRTNAARQHRLHQLPAR